MNDLLRIMEQLRAPDGCPWDREQTHASIRRNLLEEAYEAAEAIDTGDDKHLQEELGDVLLQVVFHAQIAQDAGSFTFEDVVRGLCEKLLFRHPHVFGTIDAKNSGDALTTWEAQKREEKGQKTLADALDAVARSLPALMRADKLQTKVKKAGLALDQPGLASDAAMQAMGRAMQAGQPPDEALGDALFSLVACGCLNGLDSELALHAACERFIQRIQQIQALSASPAAPLEPSELAQLWRQIQGQP